jgi:hypothetical protein
MTLARHAAALLFAAFLVSAQVAPADQPAKADSKDLIEDTATRQAQMKRAFEAFRTKLAVLAGRLDNGSPAEKKKAESLKKALKTMSDLGTAGKFDAVISGLTRKNADESIDVLGRVVKDNEELRKDLKLLINLLMDGDNAKKIAERRERLKALLERLKEAKNGQERLQARTEMEKEDAKELVKPQDKLAEQTKATLDPKEDADEQAIQEIEAIKKPVEEAVKEQKEASKSLAKGMGKAAGSSQGKAISKLDEAIKKLEELLKQQRQEERQQKLADLLARCRRMLGQQLDKDIQKTSDKKPTLVHSGRGTKLADQQLGIVRECEAAIKLVKSEETAVVFAEVFDQVHKDMDIVHSRLERTDVGLVTVTTENDIIATLQDIIKALERAMQEPDEPPQPGQGGQQGNQKLVNFLQQLKMIMAMQRRINQRTELYGKTYTGEQAPLPEAAKDEKQRKHFESVRKELKDLSDRQERLGKVTREVSKQPEAQGQ